MNWKSFVQGWILGAIFTFASMSIRACGDENPYPPAEPVIKGTIILREA